MDVAFRHFQLHRGRRLDFWCHAPGLSCRDGPKLITVSWTEKADFHLYLRVLDLMTATVAPSICIPPQVL